MTTSTPTSNDKIAAESAISVIANDGTVTIQGAAGKSVVISNILGKVVAETVLSSDNATIAVPAGIVAVAVEGEAAVKVVVNNYFIRNDTVEAGTSRLYLNIFN